MPRRGRGRRFFSQRLKTRFIINPRSGRSRFAIGPVRAFADRHGAEVVATERPRHGSDLARQALADGVELIVAVGGDGTMNEIAAVLCGTEATFGLIPCGSGNGLARQLGIHGAVSHSLQLLRDGKTTVIDSGLADGHPFFTVAGLGFEAELAARFNQLKRRGFLRYLTSGAGLLQRFESSDYTLVHADGREDVKAFTVAVANAAQYGNNALIAPGARLDDGLINLTALPPVNWWNAPGLFRRMFNGTLSLDPRVRLRVGQRFVVERRQAGLVHTDGETHQAGTSVEFTVRPASLRIRVPS
jgi:diacylglycerol kinase (ATP)